MNAGNQNATAGYLLSQTEKAMLSAMEFATSFNNFIADGPSSHQSEIIKTVNTFSGAIADVLANAKGITRFAPDDKKADAITSAARNSANSTVKFFQNLQSFRLESLSVDAKTDTVVSSNMDVQANLQKLTKLAEQYVGKGTDLSKATGDLGEHVDNELSKAAEAIDAAAARLAQLQQKSRDPGYSTYELKIHQ